MNFKQIRMRGIKNSEGISSGSRDRQKIKAVTDNIPKSREMNRHGCQFDSIYYCPHDYQDSCKCRKPGTGMLEQAEKVMGIDEAGSYLIGDSKSDIQAGISYGIKTIFVGGICVDADYSLLTILDALAII